MNSVLCQIACFVLLTVIGAPETRAGENKIRIVVPHKISYIHHHHFKVIDLKKKSEDEDDDDDDHHHHHHQKHNDEKDVEEVEEGHQDYEQFVGGQDGEPDASQGAIAYAIPAPRFSNAAANLIMQPIVLNNKSFQRIKHRPVTYAIIRYGNYMQRGMYPEESSLETTYQVSRVR